MALHGWRKSAGLLLGVGLILNGLGNSVLAIRGVDVAGPGDWIPVITLVCVIAIVGFVAAGLGVFGVTGLRRSDQSSIGAAWRVAMVRHHGRTRISGVGDSVGGRVAAPSGLGDD